ncbi:glycerophosphodiester phosphodiesterase [Desulfoferrobacter suflitae]|uniref:glycerophosphodiester phosphodiesterase n=1 Tax=Desulfoferrobacter suflitae TaxID=2865782 RepID=UPI002164891A|nr:glycerophosphodiester phosphodiesterase family protein [Desulfoferrobacter suflitae]MCK8602343.1 hypothetical protein [Desulfoferrobacter suflitae]
MVPANVHRKPLNIAHRGARSLAPENTLAAAAKALEVGADMWELDVAMTADGELVVIHDATLERTSNATNVYPDRKPWRVSDFLLKELEPLDFGSWFVRQDPFGQIAAGSVAESECARYAGEPMLTLAKALEFSLEHRLPINVEIKDLAGTAGDAVVVERAVGLIEDLGAEDYVILSSFSPSYLRRAREANAGLTTALLSDSYRENLMALLGELKTQGFHPRIEEVPRVNVAALQQCGYAVRVWVANDEAAMRAMMQTGVDAVFTDFPQLLKKILTC